MKSCYKDDTTTRPSFAYNGIPSTGKMASLYRHPLLFLRDSKIPVATETDFTSFLTPMDRSMLRAKSRFIPDIRIYINANRQIYSCQN